MRISSITKNAGKACNNRLYRHIRTFEKIVKNYFVIFYKIIIFFIFLSFIPVFLLLVIQKKEATLPCSFSSFLRFQYYSVPRHSRSLHAYIPQFLPPHIRGILIRSKILSPERNSLSFLYFPHASRARYTV